MVWIVSYKSPLLKVDMQFLLSDLNGPKDNVGCLPIAILLTQQIPIGMFILHQGKTRAESLKSGK